LEKNLPKPGEKKGGAARWGEKSKNPGTVGEKVSRSIHKKNLMRMSERSDEQWEKARGDGFVPKK